MDTLQETISVTLRYLSARSGDARIKYTLYQIYKSFIFLIEEENNEAMAQALTQRSLEDLVSSMSYAGFRKPNIVVELESLLQRVKEL